MKFVATAYEQIRGKLYWRNTNYRQAEQAKQTFDYNRSKPLLKLGDMRENRRDSP